MSNNNVDKVGCIYVLTNKINRKVYVGQTTKTFEERLKRHVYNANRGKIHHMAITYAINKHGIDNFDKIHITCDINKLDELERYYIKAFNSKVPNGYNIKSGGQSKEANRRKSEDIKESINGRLNHDKDHNLPHHIYYIEKDGYIGYIVEDPYLKFIQFSSSHLTKEEKYNLAIRYLKERNYDKILKEYRDLKGSRKRLSILKKQNIEGEEYELPSYFIWCPKERMFYIRIPGIKFKQFGHSKQTIRQNYDRALKYYNEHKHNIK